MPNDIYRWEAGGGLVHHCPVCAKPLTNPKCRNRCLGQHVEWCHQYHTQLFKKGSSGQCFPCIQSHEEHVKRHREIASLLREFNELANYRQSSASPLTRKALSIASRRLEISELSPHNGNKKERKAIKKAAKALSMPATVGAEEIESVAKALHPNEHQEFNDANVERHLIDDPDIKLNLFFNKGTSHTREIRAAFIGKKRNAPRVEYVVDEKELEAVIRDLGVPSISAISNPKARKVALEIRNIVEEDLKTTHHEQEQLMMRKGGFWRWASRKAYDRLLAHGSMVWDHKTADAVHAKIKAGLLLDDGIEVETVSSVSFGDGEAKSIETEVTETSSSGSEQDEESAAALAPTTPKPLLGEDNNRGDEWMTVNQKLGLKTLTQESTVTLKFVHNNGLDRLGESPRGSTARFGHYDDYSTVWDHDTDYRLPLWPD